MVFWLNPLFGQSSIEKNVLENVHRMMESQDTVIFSELYNDERFSSEEKAFLGRLYEIFFQIPAFLKSEYESTGDIPARRDIAAGFGVSLQSVDLLLTVMEFDRRVPPLFQRNPQNKEIQSLELDNINAFIDRRGNTVKVTEWEGERLPVFELTSFQNQKLRSQDLAGKNVLIYFWFTGCPPCIRIAPILEALDRKYSASHFQVIGFNADQVIGLEVTDQQRKDYLQEHNLHYANVQVDQPTREAFGNINVFPTLFFVDSSGTIFRHMINYQDQETLESVIRELIQAG